MGLRPSFWAWVVFFVALQHRMAWATGLHRPANVTTSGGLVPSKRGRWRGVEELRLFEVRQNQRFGADDLTSSYEKLSWTEVTPNRTRVQGEQFGWILGIGNDD